MSGSTADGGGGACCACRTLRRVYWHNDDGTTSEGGWRCPSCGRTIEPPTAREVESDGEVMERTLFHLHLADAAWTRAGADAPGLSPGRGVSDWPELVLAVAGGVQRGWVVGCSILGEGKDHTMNYGLTKRGRRALAAYRKRLADYPVVEEGDDD